MRVVYVIKIMRGGACLGYLKKVSYRSKSLQTTNFIHKARGFTSDRTLCNELLKLSETFKGSGYSFEGAVTREE
jgi:hypothetical protein